MSKDFDQVTRRTHQYWFVDGFVELSVGVIFLVISLYFYLQTILPNGSLVLFILQAGFVALLIGAIFLGRYVVGKLKSSLVFPRTGFVSYKKASNKHRTASVVLGTVIASLNVALFVTSPKTLYFIPAVTGLIVGIVWLILAYRIGLIRFYLQSMLSMLLGAGLSMMKYDVYQSLAVYYGTMGIILLISGGATLAKYLQLYSRSENDSLA